MPRRGKGQGADYAVYALRGHVGPAGDAGGRGCECRQAVAYAQRVGYGYNPRLSLLVESLIMQIARNTVVTLEYTVHDADGNLVDDGENPIVYLHGGYEGIFFRLEELLHGKNVGDAMQVKLQPDEAFGDYDESLVVIEPASMFPFEIEIGMPIERTGDEEEDEGVFMITDIADGKVVLDGNHPLAGQALVFDLKVIDVRPATAREIEREQPDEAQA